MLFLNCQTHMLAQICRLGCLAGATVMLFTGLINSATAESPAIASDSNRGGSPELKAENSMPRGNLGFRPACAHPVSVVEANVYVNHTRTTMKLKCFAEDLELLQGIEAMQDGFYDSEELVDATKDHAEYLAERITFRNAKGELLEPKVTEIIDIEFPEGGIAAGKLMEHTMGFVIEYRYPDNAKPEFLTIEQKMVAEGQLLPSEFKVLLKQAGSDTPFVKMMKPSQPETFSFDWERPVLNEDDSAEDWEDWFAEQRTKSLGITSYSSVYSFIYITDYEVRHEILIPLATLATLMDLERADDNFLEIDEQEAASEKIKKYFSVGNPVTIDGVQVSPVFDRVDFYGLDLRDFAMQAEKRKVSMANGRVGLIISYSTKGRPTDVEVGWDKFNNMIKTVDGVVFIGDKVEKTQFSMFLSDNTFRWTAPDRKPLPEITGISSTLDLSPYQQPKLKAPFASIGLLAFSVLIFFVGTILSTVRKPCFGIAAMLMIGSLLLYVGKFETEINHPNKSAKPFRMPDEDSTQVFAQLHKNLFRAFDYRDESDVYDALAQSVSGEELRRIYLQINESLKVEEQGGAIARINEVVLLDGHQVEASPPEGPAENPEQNPFRFKYVGSWKLDGTIEHWGHIHQRETKFDGEFDIELVDDAWKITRMQVVDQTMGVVKTSVRTF